jgi:threonine aldolase
MLRFECDYLEGAHPKIMERLANTNLVQTPGYGEDIYCKTARDKILALCGREGAEAHFMVGGTQANLTVISAALRPHQGVISAASGHINVHETGAIEATGHKVLAVPGKDGKLTANQVRTLCAAHYADSTHEHMVQPGMVYISHPTENGTCYTLAELTALSAACGEAGLPLFMDGARLGYALAAPQSDMTLRDIARLCDMFTIGGTKVGALFGEAVVITARPLQKDFRYFIKQRGGMLAKGRLLGLQFDTLFTDGLYFQIAGHADKLAMEIRLAFESRGIPFLFPSYTNQQFPILSDGMIEKLSSKYTFALWEPAGNGQAVRFCTSWATTDENAAELINDIRVL